MSNTDAVPDARDKGETLVELLVATTILGIAGVAIMAGILMSVKSSTLSKNQASGGAFVRNFAEAVQQYVDQNGLRPCSSAAADYVSVSVQAVDGETYDKSVQRIESWTGTSWSATCSDTALRRVKLAATTTGDANHRADESIWIVLRRPCSGPASAVGDQPC